jgi:hypothetical protein
MLYEVIDPNTVSPYLRRFIGMRPHVAKRPRLNAFTIEAEHAAEVIRLEGEAFAAVARKHGRLPVPANDLRAI